MTCEKSAQIHAYHDGEVSPEDARAWAAHLSECGECTALLSELRGLTAMIGRAAMPEMRPMAVGRYYAAWTQARDRALLRITSWLTAAAAAVLIGALSLWPHAQGDGRKTTAHRPAMWEAVAVAPPAETQAESNSELVQVAQWMADDLSLGGGSSGERR
jgi:anti-sigma factor RsiW